MSYSGAIYGAFVAFIVWIILSALAPVLPYGLGALITVVGILVAISDIESTTSGPAVVGALVTMMLALSVNDQPTSGLYFLAAFLGVLSLFNRANRGGL